MTVLLWGGVAELNVEYFGWSNGLDTALYENINNLQQNQNIATKQNMNNFSLTTCILLFYFDSSVKQEY